MHIKKNSSGYSRGVMEKDVLDFFEEVHASCCFVCIWQLLICFLSQLVCK